MNRRSLLGFLATVPFIVGTLVRPSDGVALNSMAHPRVIYPEWKMKEIPLNEESLLSTVLELPVYARRGEMVVCEEPGHHHQIGFFNEDLCIGDLDWGKKLTATLGQVQPKSGDALPLRCLCGARYFDEQHRFHLHREGWRDIPKREGLRINALPRGA